MATGISNQLGQTMTIEDFLSPDDVLVDVRVADKTALLTDLAKRASAAVGVDHALICGELLKREDLGSTGVGAGLAIPHARVAGIARPFGVMARLAKAIDFAAIDGKPVDIVFLLLLPAAPAGAQLNALASVTRKLRDPERLAAVRRASDKIDVLRLMTTA
jgi:PTS system nitrogen regulatory IIA component